MADILIVVHAALGGIALAAGLIALSVKKGGKIHVLAGRAFFWSMLTSALTAIVVTLFPGHSSPFLFSIGVFSSYLIGTGYRATRFKRKDVSLGLDYALSLLMLSCGLGMILLPLILSGALNIVLAIFGGIGIAFAVVDALNFRNPAALRKKWLGMHLSKMVSGYIAAVTAFIVVNQFFTSWIAWLGPSVIGTAFIIYWMRRIAPKPRQS